MATYIERQPPDIQRLIQSYSDREVTIEVTGRDSLGGIRYIISLACGSSILRLPFADNPGRWGSMKRFVLANEPELRNASRRPWIARMRKGSLSVVIDDAFEIYLLTDRQVHILMKKLLQLVQDDVAGKVQNFY